MDNEQQAQIRTKNHYDEVRKEVKEKTIGYITAAFGLVAGLAWNEAIKSLLDSIYPAGKQGIAVKFLYAGIVTVLLVIITRYLIKASKNE